MKNQCNLRPKQRQQQKPQQMPQQRPQQRPQRCGRSVFHASGVQSRSFLYFMQYAREIAGKSVALLVKYCAIKIPYILEVSTGPKFLAWPAKFFVRPGPASIRPGPVDTSIIFNSMRPAACNLWLVACGLQIAACGPRTVAKYEPVKSIRSFYFACGLWINRTSHYTQWKMDLKGF